MVESKDQEGEQSNQVTGGVALEQTNQEDHTGSAEGEPDHLEAHSTTDDAIQ